MSKKRRRAKGIRVCRDTSLLNGQAGESRGDKPGYTPKPRPYAKMYRTSAHKQASGYRTFDTRAPGSVFHRWAADGCYPMKYEQPIVTVSKSVAGRGVKGQGRSNNPWLEHRSRHTQYIPKATKIKPT